MFVLLLLLKLYGTIETAVPGLRDWNIVILFSLLFVMFALSYRKQTSYITKRIKANE